MNRKHAVPLAISVFLFALVSPVLSAQSSDPCKDEASQQAWDDASSPVYADAGELARTLSIRGFVVQCIRRSVGEHLFSTEKGAAWFKTDQGVFEVWFLQKSQSFSSLEINDQQQSGGRYIYTFRGNRALQLRWTARNRYRLSSMGICCLKCGGMSRWRQASARRFAIPDAISNWSPDQN